MKKFKVGVERMSLMYAEIEVEAENEDEAHREGYRQARDLDFSLHGQEFESDYRVHEIEEIEEDED